MTDWVHSTTNELMLAGHSISTIPVAVATAAAATAGIPTLVCASIMCVRYRGG